MATLVPYATYPPNAARAFSTAAGAGRYAYKNRKAIAAAATKFQRFYRRRQSSRRDAKLSTLRKIGEEPGFNTDKKCQLSSNVDQSKDSRTLYSKQLVAIVRASTANEIDRRERNACHILSFNINLSVLNNGSLPLICNFAVIASKNSDGSTPSATDFFRDYSSSRARDFDTSLTAQQFSQYPINTDQFRLVGKWSKTIGSANQDKFHTFKRNVNFNRQITYDDTSGTPRTRVYLVYWFDQFNAAASAISVTAVANVQENIVTRFRDIVPGGVYYR